MINSEDMDTVIFKKIEKKSKNSEMEKQNMRMVRRHAVNTKISTSTDTNNNTIKR